MEKDIVTLAHRTGKGCNRRGAGSLDEAEASGEEDISVGGFGFCRLETNMVTGRARARWRITSVTDCDGRRMASVHDALVSAPKVVP